MPRDPEIVTASDIANWVYCPESVKLRLTRYDLIKLSRSVVRGELFLPEEWHRRSLELSALARG